MQGSVETRSTWFAKRRALLVAPIALGFTACGAEQKFEQTPALKEPTGPNAALIKELRNDLAFAPTTTRTSYGQNLGRVTLESPRWMIGRTIEYVGEQGLHIRYTIDENGEGRFAHDPTLRVRYPNPLIEREELRVTTLLGERGRHVALYGTVETVERLLLLKDQQTIKAFARDYFSDTQYPSVLHLIFVLNASSVALVDIGSIARIQTDDSHIGREATTMDRQGNIKRFDVMVNIPFLHAVAVNTDLSLQKKLVGTLANEMATLLIRQSLPPRSRFSLPPSTEAASTLTATLTSLDDESANLLLGGSTYIPFVNLIDEEAHRISSIRPRE